MILYILLIAYFGFIFWFTGWEYKTFKPYYSPLTYQKDSNSEKIDVHKLYDEFEVKDKLSYYKLLLGNIFILPIKTFFSFWIAILMNMHLRYYLKRLKNPESDPKERKIMADIISFWARWFFFINCVKIDDKKLPYEEVYKKYLGNDYDFSDQRYSLIISNHTGYFDVVTNMIKHSAGFLAAKTVKDYYFIGPIAQAMNCLFVERESSKDRNQIFQQIEQRQKDFYEKKNLAPLVLFPEGTTTCGRYILKFKKGAFYALLPIKPQIIGVYPDDDFQVAVGATSVVYNYMRSLAEYSIRIYYADLPVIKPTDFMWEKYSHLGTEKWEIYAEVTRHILSEISGLKESNKNYRDEKRYNEAVLNGIYVPEDEDKKEK